MPGNRRSIRLKNYDYKQQGGYFVTICTNDRKCIFGDVINNEMILNNAGKMGKCTWIDLTQHNENIELDEYIIMPNHIHGIINIVGAGSKPALKHNHASIKNNGNKHNEIIINRKIKRAGLEPAPTAHGLSEIVRQFKTFSAKRMNQINKTPNVCLWQRNYYEHIIRGEHDLNRIREYISNNPATWDNDENNPVNYQVTVQATCPELAEGA